MGGEIFQLAFVASRRPGLRAGTWREQNEHMASSGAVFAVAKVTGLVLVKGPRLLYHLEGAEQQVMSLFRRIESDPRVHGIVVLRRRFVDQRAFSNWDFAFESKPMDSGAKPLVQQVKELVAGAPADVALYFLSFARLDPPKAA